MKHIFIAIILCPLILLAEDKKAETHKTKKDAKAECKSEGKTVGNDLLDCVKDKTKHAK